MQVYTGHLVAVVRQHYQVVNVLKFTDDGTYLLSGGADARVLVWKFSRLILKMLLEIYHIITNYHITAMFAMYKGKHVQLLHVP